MTPAMLQFKKIKTENPDCIVFFRMGDFYETFFEDAITSSKVLNITLTSRDKTTNNTPMAGIPYHALDTYLVKMVNAGYKVCIVEQMEDPKTVKGIVKRDVVKIITPGTLSGELLGEYSSNYLCSIYIQPKNVKKSNKDKIEIGFAYIDSTIGEFKLTSFSTIRELDDELYKLKPNEVLIPTFISQIILSSNYISRNIKVSTPLPASAFDYDNAYKRLTNLTSTKSLKGFGIDDNNIGINSAGGILQYLTQTQKTSLDHINSISFYSVLDLMILDKSTIQNLEIIESPLSKNTATLFNLLNKTRTNMGGRGLFRLVLNPHKDLSPINSTLNQVEYFFQNLKECTDIRSTLEHVCDIERLVGKMGLGTCNALDLIQLLKSLDYSKEILSIFKKNNSKVLENITNRLDTLLSQLEPIKRIIQTSINPNPPLTLKEGNIIQSGISSKLDEIKQSLTNGKDWIRNLEKEEIKITGINTLKVRFNSVFGYYIEVSKGSISKVPSSYIRKQTLVNAERYITPQLKEQETIILGAQEKCFEIEFEIFIDILKQTKSYISQFQNLARVISEIDIFTNFAYIAHEYNYVKPLVNNSDSIIIKEGRHPVIEWINKSSINQFITNDTNLSNDGMDFGNPLVILTGPNMGGKSTYIRQIALITLMSHIGCFVPAKQAQIGVVDRIFTRVGASDNLSFGESTFMVEMIESANILNNATSKSLIILDEVGRGTSTYDGLSIAWAIVEYICKYIKAKTLFATHYHELTQMEAEFKNIINYTVAVAQTNGEIIFLRKIVKGKSEKSFGIHVAKLAGLPDEVITTSTRILKGLEQKSQKSKGFSTPQLNIFEDGTLSKPNNHSAIEDELRKIDMNMLTPLEALNKINDLKKLLSS